ncbi:general substrate transporter [Linderina pennispora]|uniref:General substrate transporter n=1 Tax=Linderina pennispora TaxID=61395 RepID=A0A1Y1WMR6_9FUNG|nr:general substrate transporter [Linderina pennispora]ORX74857.1 general substrate transporter [Linderina pennispora]
MSVDSRTLSVTKYQCFCAMMAALGSVNFGWNIGVINIPGDVISNCVTGEKHYNGPFPSCIPTESTIWGVAVGCFAIGALIGTIAGNPISDRYGRKFVLTWGPLLALVGGVLLSTTTSLGQLIVGRLFVGFAAGFCNGALSVYVGEITTPKARDILGGTLQLATNVGILLANAVSLGLAKPPLWRILFGITGVIGVATTLLFPICVESPKWLVSRGRVEEARAALIKLRKGADIEQELQDMVDDDAKAQARAEEAPKVNVMDLILGRTPDNLRHQFIVVCMLMFFQQMSGINAVIFYSTQIFNRTTKDDPSQIPTTAQILSCVISIVAAIFTFVGMLLGARFGRRTLMLLSHGTMALFSMLMAVGSIKGIDGLVITMVFLYNVFFNFGVGPLPWAAAAEMTPAYAMSAMAAIGGAVNYLFTFAIGVYFSPMQEAMGDYTFFFFMGFNIAAFVFCFFFLPETKGLKVEDVVAVHSVGLHCVLGSRYQIRASKDNDDSEKAEYA